MLCDGDFAHEAVPRDTWVTLFCSQGMNHQLARSRMIDGFNEGWIDFEGGSAEHRTSPGSRFEAVFKDLVAQADMSVASLMIPERLHGAPSVTCHYIE